MAMEAISSSQQMWQPELAFHYHKYYPQTSQLNHDLFIPANDIFYELWKQSKNPTSFQASDVEVILIRGIFGKLMPGHFQSVLQTCHEMGLQASLAPSYLAESLLLSAQRIQLYVQQAQRKNRRLVFLAHSKGGLDILTLLAQDADLRARTLGLILVQTPSGSSRVLDQIFLQKYRQALSPGQRVTVNLQKIAISALQARRGCLEITEKQIANSARPLQKLSFPFPFVTVSSWSTQPTAWLDSFHETLRRIVPGVAHDGQFLTHEQLWPQSRQLLLPHIDHAQPVVGGHGFPVGQFWATLLRFLARC